MLWARSPSTSPTTRVALHEATRAGKHLYILVLPLHHSPHASLSATPTTQMTTQKRLRNFRQRKKEKGLDTPQSESILHHIPGKKSNLPLIMGRPRPRRIMAMMMALTRKRQA